MVQKVSTKTWDKEQVYVKIPIGEDAIRTSGLGVWDTLAYDSVGKCFSLRLSRVTWFLQYICTLVSNYVVFPRMCRGLAFTQFNSMLRLTVMCTFTTQDM